jgi:hypothetical protein
MKYVEERFARELHSELDRHFRSLGLGVQLSLNGAGVHWGCTSTLGTRVCKVNCLDLRIGGRGAEYLSSFNEGNQTIVWGRTISKQDTVLAASSWLQGSSLDDLEAGFGFVDAQRRRLLQIAHAVTDYEPAIQGATTQLKRQICDLCEFWFKYRERSCKLWYYGKNEFSNATFYWDNCELFRFQAENLEKLAAVLKRWLCDEAKPSEMRIDFPWIEIGELADYYEAGKPIEGEFVTSWNSIERFYSKVDFPPKKKILKLITELREHGYDKSLRAGQSMFSFILSRSRRHGLQANQPCLIFSFKEASMEIKAHFENDETFPFPQITFSPQLEVLLQRLIAAEID